jgi:hypothetical protein
MRACPPAQTQKFNAKARRRKDAKPAHPPAEKPQITQIDADRPTRPSAGQKSLVSGLKTAGCRMRVPTAHLARYEIRDASVMSFRPSESSERVEESMGWLLENRWLLPPPLPLILARPLAAYGASPRPWGASTPGLHGGRADSAF